VTSPTLRQQAEERAVLCTRIARALLPGAGAGALETRALELMDLDDERLRRLLENFDLVANGSEQPDTRSEPGRLPLAEATRLAELMVLAGRDGARLRIVEEFDPLQRREVESLSKNPCKTCGTYRLQEKWVGSAYCSLECCLNELDQPEYAESMLRHYEAHNGVRVCRNCGNEQDVGETMTGFLRGPLEHTDGTTRWPQHECPKCGETTP